MPLLLLVVVSGLLFTWKHVDTSFRLSLKRNVRWYFRYACAIAPFVPHASVTAVGMAWSGAMAWATAPAWFEIVCAGLRCSFQAIGVAVAVVLDADRNGTLLDKFPMAVWIFVASFVGVILFGMCMCGVCRGIVHRKCSTCIIHTAE